MSVRYKTVAEMKIQDVPLILVKVQLNPNMVERNYALHAIQNVLRQYNYLIVVELLLSVCLQ